MRINKEVEEGGTVISIEADEYDRVDTLMKAVRLHSNTCDGMLHNEVRIDLFQPVLPF